MPDLTHLRRYPELEGKTFLLGIGAMKCATSWVFQHVAGMPEVAATPLKELHFFNAKFPPKGHPPFTPRMTALVQSYLAEAPDPVGEVATNSHLQAAIDGLQMLYDDNAYFGHFARMAQARTRVFTEITPQYALLDAQAFGYVRAFFQTQGLVLKVLLVLRDPVARLWSHLRSLTQEDPEIDVLRDWQTLVRQRAVIERSDYIRTIRMLDQVFHPDQLLILFSEDLVDGRSLPALSQTLGLPGLPPDTIRQNRTPDTTALPDAVRGQLRRLLAPQYTFCQDRLGALPAAWNL
ncbi:MAG: sulfotransferase [Pseudomonadota bacterium]